MTTTQKNEAIEVLKGKFSEYSNFYLTNTESLSVAQINTLRKTCHDTNVEMKVAKNTLIRKALESINEELYSGTFDSLNGVTALMFSENPKQPALIISDFRKANKGTERPTLKAAFIDGAIYTGDEQLATLRAYKSKQDLIGEIISLLQAPIQRVIGALENKEAATGAATTETVEAAPEVAPAVEAAAEAPAAESAPETEAPTADAPEA